MPNITYTILKQRQKMNIKIYSVLCALLFVWVGWYFFQKWTAYSAAREAVAQNSVTVETLQTKISEAKGRYDSEKAELGDLQKDVETKLTYVFPTQDDYTVLTRQMDSYEEELFKKNSLFEISSIDFSTPTSDERYSILPVRMNIRSSAANFTKFLHLMENSGSLNDQMRLMDISSIRLNFENSQGDSALELIDFTVQINAYFQK